MKYFPIFSFPFTSQFQIKIKPFISLSVQDEPRESGLASLPLIYGFAVFVNVLSVFLDGSPGITFEFLLPSHHYFVLLFDKMAHALSWTENYF